MSKIHLLDNSTITKIAAGEVIERPSSVVKELVENALDANSDDIVIKLKKGGKKQISVIDNGTGMEKADLLLCAKRHATSKISRIEDLFNIFSYGFRGEALATISEVSKMEIISGTKDLEISYKLVLENGKQKDLLPETKFIGTIVNVYNLFYNIPARQKFLKSDAYELKRIADWIKSIAVANPKISFKLYNDDKQILEYKKANSIKSRIKDVFGLDVFLGESKDPIVDAKVYYTNPTDLKEYNANAKQIYFINNRPILNTTIAFAIRKAFESKIPKGRKPNVFVFLKINPKVIDINVHPQKLEVRVRDSNTFFYPVYTALTKSLEQGVSDSVERKTKIISLIEKEYTENNIKELTTKYNPKSNNKLNMSQETLSFNSNKGITDNSSKTNYKILGQYNNTFILVEDVNESLLIIDQHVAEERYNFEKFMKLFDNNKAINQQQLIVPLDFEFDKDIIEIFNSNKDLFLTFGFDISTLKDSIVVRSIPTVLGRIPEKNELREMLLEITNNFENKESLKKDNLINNLRVNILKSLACKSSVKADTPLSFFEMKQIVENLFTTKNPYTCPHGRPIIIELTKKEIYHKIGRL